MPAHCVLLVLNRATPTPQSVKVLDGDLQPLLGLCLSWALAQQPKQGAPRRRDYYDILKVPKGAADSVIKRSYRKLALQYHPVRPPFPALGLNFGCMGGRPAEGGLPPALLIAVASVCPAGQGEGLGGGEIRRGQEVCRHKPRCCPSLSVASNLCSIASAMP